MCLEDFSKIYRSMVPKEKVWSALFNVCCIKDSPDVRESAAFAIYGSLWDAILELHTKDEETWLRDLLQKYPNVSMLTQDMIHQCDPIPHKKQNFDTLNKIMSAACPGRFVAFEYSLSLGQIAHGQNWQWLVDNARLDPEKDTTSVWAWILCKLILDLPIVVY